MSEKLADRLAQAGQRLDPGFGASDVERGLAALEQRIVKRRQLKRGAVALVSLTAAAFLSSTWLREHVPEQQAPQAAQMLTTRDGSVATLLDAQTVLGVERDAAEEVALRLERGKGHFEVTPDPKRRYRVHAGQVEVEVLGTAFEVERQGASTRVRVEHGLVRVAWSGGSTTLGAGQSGSFPPGPVKSQAALARSDLAMHEPAVPEEAQLAKPELQRERWRVLARAGKHQQAFGSLGSKQVDDLAGLLLAADAARLSGHPREAARFLEQLVQRYPESATAPLAAFTLGRLALYELKQPALAAKSFARAYTFNPTGPLAEDALAREAEAYHRAGDAQRAKSAAQRYLERFPDGARREELARYAASDATDATDATNAAQ
jgi:transmembrane sensor